MSNYKSYRDISAVNAGNKAKKEPYYTKYSYLIKLRIVKNIYANNKLLGERIKYTFIKPTDPILHKNSECEKETKKKTNEVMNKVIRNTDSFIFEGSNNHNKFPSRNGVNRSVDYCLKSSYEIFYTPDKDNTNQKILQELQKAKKSNKKMFMKEKSASMIEDDTTPSKKKRKMFPGESLKSSLNFSYLDNKESNITERQKKQYVGIRSNSIYSNNNRDNKTIDANGINPSYSNRKQYPYAKDHMKEIFANGKNFTKEYKYTGKISNNPFDILKRVPKFNWEK